MRRYLSIPCTRGAPLVGRRRLGVRRESTSLEGSLPSLSCQSNKTVRRVRVRGGNVKWRALRLATRNYSWGSEAVTRKTRILDVVYNASNNELIRTQTLVKSKIIHVDAASFRQWYLQHYGVDIGRKKKALSGSKKDAKEAEATAEKVQKSQHVHGYILEGKELEFYVKKIQRKKRKGAGAA